MSFSKIAKKQDSYYILNEGKSGETSINISDDILDYITDGNYTRGNGQDITFKLYREDFAKAIALIASSLPLYTCTSKSSQKISDTFEVIRDLSHKVDSYFGDSTEKLYQCVVYPRKDGRNYLNNLSKDGFSIRNFLVESTSVLVFERLTDGSNITAIRLLKPEYDLQASLPETKEEILISESKHRTFVLNCLMYFSKLPVWNNIENFLGEVKPDSSVKVFKENEFSLVGMFRNTTEEQINELNTPTKRWYLDSFEIRGHNMYLSTEWYPEDSPVKKYSLTIVDFAKFVSTCFGKEYNVAKSDENGDWQLKRIITLNQNDSLGKKIGNNSSTEQKDFSIKHIIKLIDSTGLLYTDDLIKRFAFSLMSKPFLILSGLAGSGKTQLALAFAKALIASDEQLCVVSVGADWTNREPLLGFPNALEPNAYVRPESGVLDLLIEANREENANKPYFLILDEMNMSYVERYFSDFLSSMESHEPIALWKGTNDSVPQQIGLPRNLFIIGTINVDETTYMFSPKVLDRANVIEFKINDSEMAVFLKALKPVDRDAVNYKACNMGASFVAISKKKELASDETIAQTLGAFFKELKSVNAEFGYRSATEIYRFIRQSQENDDTVNKLELDDILDFAIVQKLLPKLHGSRKKLQKVLEALWKLCFNEAVDKEQPISREQCSRAKYPLTADKIQRMNEAAYDNGFTSFAEA